MINQAWKKCKFYPIRSIPQNVNFILDTLKWRLDSSVGCASDYEHDAPGSILSEIGNFSVQASAHAHSACHK